MDAREFWGQEEEAWKIQDQHQHYGGSLDTSDPFAAVPGWVFCTDSSFGVSAGWRRSADVLGGLHINGQGRIQGELQPRWRICHWVPRPLNVSITLYLPAVNLLRCISLLQISHSCLGSGRRKEQCCSTMVNLRGVDFNFQKFWELKSTPFKVDKVEKYWCNKINFNLNKHMVLLNGFACNTFECRFQWTLTLREMPEIL